MHSTVCIAEIARALNAMFFHIEAIEHTHSETYETSEIVLSAILVLVLGASITGNNDIRSIDKSYKYMLSDMATCFKQKTIAHYVWMHCTLYFCDWFVKNYLFCFLFN